MNVTLPPLAGAAAQVWPLLFDLAADQPTGWVLAGSQMVIVHAAAHGITRPLVTEDADVLVDIRHLPTAEVASWLQQHGIELQDVSPDGIGHRFRRGRLAIDVLSIDHAGNADRTTVPPARTIQVPGGRRAVGRIQPATITTAEGATGTIPVPDWLGAVLLKARAAVNVPDQRPKHAQDLALLLSLPIDIPHWVDELAGRDRRHLRDASALLDETAWNAIAHVVDIRAGRAALALLTQSHPSR